MYTRWSSLLFKYYLEDDIGNVRLLTTESSTGKKIVAVLKFDVTSVKKPLIMTIIIIAAGCGTWDTKPRTCATLCDNFDVFKKIHSIFLLYIHF